PSTDRRIASDPRPPHFYRCCDLWWGLLFPGRDDRLVAFSRCADASTCTNQGGQSRSWTGWTGFVAACGLAGRSLEGGLRLVICPAFRRDRNATHRPAGTARWAVRVTLEALFDIGLVTVLLAIAVWVIAARAAFTAIVAYIGFGLLVAIAWV